MNKIRIIKKYPNRRLYDTEISSYITLEEVKALVLKHVNFCVIDSKTAKDMTNNILLQIISEQENNGSPIFTKEILQNIIRFYGDDLQATVSQYLERGINIFVTQQQQLQESMQKLVGLNPEVQAMASMLQKNLSLWEATLSPFLPINYESNQVVQNSEKISEPPPATKTQKYKKPKTKP